MVGKLNRVVSWWDNKWILGSVGNITSSKEATGPGESPESHGESLGVTESHARLRVSRWTW